VGIALVHGKGVAKDEAAGVAWLRRAADAGFAEAQLNLFYCYRDGVAGLRADDPAATPLLRAAAEGGVVEAQAVLGHALLWGMRMPQDAVAGVALLQKASEGGDLAACLFLGDAHVRGLGGLPVNAATARALYERAAASVDGELAAAARSRLTELASAPTSAVRAAVPTGIPPVCAHTACGAPLNAGTLSGLCAGCRAVRFCGCDCQRAGWPAHRPACKAAAAARTAAACAAAPPSPAAGPAASPTPALIAERAEVETWARMPLDALRAAAEAGTPAAQAALGNAYCEGWQGLGKDQTVGAGWLRKAAAGGMLSVRARSNVMLAPTSSLAGAAAAAALAEARDFVVPAAAAGDAAAQSTAFASCMRLAAARSGDAAAALWAEAGKWLRLAAGQGEENALLLSAQFLWDGHAAMGIKRDRAEARRLFAAVDATGVTKLLRAVRPAGALGSFV
jgi:hypothetical protein